MKRSALSHLGRTLRISSLSLAAVLLTACAEPPPPALPPPAPPPPAPAPVVIEEPKPQPKPEPPPEPTPLELPGPIVFATGSDQLSPESEPSLKAVQAFLAQQTKVTLLRIEGHTDNQGIKNKNQKLSEARALSVAAWLIKGGVDCKRLLPVGFGDTKPIAENKDDDGRSKNRRTVFISTAVDGKDLSGGTRDGGGKVAGDPCKP